MKKISVKIYGETYRATAELYYSGEALIFAYQRLQRYDTHIAMKPPPKVVKILETRVYYNGAKAIRVIQGKKLTPKTEAAFDEAVLEMTELSDTLKAALN